MSFSQVHMLLLKQFYLNCLAHASYVVADTESGGAAVVDPQRDIDQYLAFADEHHLTIQHVIPPTFTRTSSRDISSCATASARRSIWAPEARPSTRSRRWPTATESNSAPASGCAGGYRSSLAVSLLERAGVAHVSELAGGLAAWEAAGLPVTDA